VWRRFGHGRVQLGITDFAQHALHDVTFVRLPQVGSAIEAGALVSEVESLKSDSDVYSPVAGTVVAVNSALSGSRELVNDDPYGQGWIYELESTANKRLMA
jgi:glycine cleavage system H protein